MIHNNTFFKKLNKLGRNREQFLFIIDFEGKNPEVFPLKNLPEDIWFQTPNISNQPLDLENTQHHKFVKYPVHIDVYREKFNSVLSHIRNGDTYLINLTQPTRVDMDLDLKSIYHLAKASYKLYFRDKFVVFSPESFVKIMGRRISTYPMKGTIDSSIPDAESILLNDPKEISEHNTIVDLMRNDLSMVASNVKVDRFRYIESINTHEKTILQASSEISGLLPENHNGNIGDILSTLLPAGSISGAPKNKTVEILLKNEGYSRGYYTGVFGIFDGFNLDSAVMIRYIEKDEKGFIYKSGGGITFRSEVEKEYQELIDKVYVPLT